MNTKRLGVPIDANCLSLSLCEKNICIPCSQYKEACVFNKNKKRYKKYCCNQHWNRLPKEQLKHMGEQRQRVFIQVWEDLDKLGYKLDPAYTNYKKNKVQQKDEKAQRTNQQLPPTSPSSKGPSTPSISQRPHEYCCSPLYHTSDILGSPSSPVSSFKLRPLAASSNNEYKRKTNKKRKNAMQGRNGGLLKTPSPFKKAEKKINKHPTPSPFKKLGQSIHRVLTGKVSLKSHLHYDVLHPDHSTTTNKYFQAPWFHNSQNSYVSHHSQNFKNTSSHHDHPPKSANVFFQDSSQHSYTSSCEHHHSSFVHSYCSSSSFSDSSCNEDAEIEVDMDELKENKVKAARFDELMKSERFKKMYENAEKAKKYDKIMQSKLLNCKRFCPTKKGREILSSILPLNPQLSLDAAESTIGLAMAYTLNELSIEDVSPQQIATATPSIYAIRREATMGAAHSHYLSRKSVLEEGSHLFFSCDKGASGDFIKKPAHYNFTKKKVVTFLLDCDQSDGSSKDCALNVEYSMKKFKAGLDDDRLLLYGCTTDSGGGGTGISFRDALVAKKGITCDITKYLISFCTIHILNLCLSNPIELLMGTGGLLTDSEGKEAGYIKNLLQALHGLYDLEQRFEAPRWKELWEDAARKAGVYHLVAGKRGKVKKMQRPVLTRWWTIGEAAKILLEYFEIYVQIVKDIEVAKGIPQRIKKIASGLEELLKVPMIYSDANLIKGFCTYFFDKHLAWMQRGDPELGNTPGFLSRHMAERYYIMQNDLLKIAEEWNANPHFQGFCMFKDLNDEEKKMQNEKIKSFCTLLA